MKPTPEPLGYAATESVMGNLLVVTSSKGVVGSFSNQPFDVLLLQAQRRFEGHLLKENLHKAKTALTAALKTLEDPTVTFSFPLDMRTTPFRKKVWEAILTIPAGEFSTYAEIAKLAGSPRAMRAVGSACTHCDFDWIVPCHRVLHANENFTTNKDTSALRRHALIQREMAYSESKKNAALRLGVKPKKKL